MMKKNFIYKLFLCGMILSGSILQAQSIKGKVSDSGGPIPLVNIVVNGTNINTTTDFDGNFVLTKVNPSDVIVLIL